MLTRCLLVSFTYSLTLYVILITLLFTFISSPNASSFISFFQVIIRRRWTLLRWLPYLRFFFLCLFLGRWCIALRFRGAFGFGVLYLHLSTSLTLNLSYLCIVHLPSPSSSSRPYLSSTCLHSCWYYL